MKKLRIGIVNLDDPLDIRTWSGTTYYIARTLEKYCGQIVNYGPIKIPLKRVKQLYISVSHQVADKIFYYYYVDEAVISSYAKQLEDKIARSPVDVLVVPGGITYIAKLNSINCPIIVVQDATYPVIQDFYPFSAAFLKKAEQWELKGLQRADLCVYSSNWAAESAVKDYGIPPDKIRVIPFGANCEAPLELKLENKMIDKTLNLLFVAARWHEKGGDIAVSIVEELNKLGVLSKLIVVGCKPEGRFNERIVEVIPYLDKNKLEDRQKLTELYQKGHFLLLPVLGDCTPIVVSEANAYGLPAITRLVGGLGSIVKNGINGYTLPVSASSRDYAVLIYNIVKDQKRYLEMVGTSRKTYDEFLNWDAWGRKIKLEIELLLDNVDYERKYEL